MDNHFNNQDALSHVVDKKIEGILSLSESHGTEVPGPISAASDAARESAIVLLLLWLFLQQLSFPHIGSILLAFGVGWVAWKTGRSGWLGWVRLERLHRIIQQEKYEIEHHRQQEKEELMALYQTKGFEGQLLEDVVAVLMADEDRLLHVMLEEELGLTLEAHEHPLKQALGAMIGSFTSLIVTLALFSLAPTFGIWISTFCLVAGASAFSAYCEKNAPISAVVWNLSIGALAFGIAYFVFQISLQR